MVLIPEAPEVMETRDASPAHFLIKIQSLSSLDTFGIDKYEWKLIIFPKGDKIGKDSGHISVHLAMADESSMSGNWEVDAVFNIFLFNQICDNYSSLGTTRRFHSMKSEWGFSKFISKKIFSDPSNGYLVDDKCVFGAEVFVIKSKAITECLTLKNVHIPYARDLIIPSFSKLGNHSWFSEVFIAGGHKWKVRVDPKGCAGATAKYVSMYFFYEGSERVKANVTLCIKNQLDPNKHKLMPFTCWFGDTIPGWGFPSFMELATTNDPKQGFIVKDSCHINVKISVQAVVRGSPLLT